MRSSMPALRPESAPPLIWEAGAVRSSGLRRRCRGLPALVVAASSARRARPSGRQDRGARRFADRRLSACRPGGVSGQARAGAQGQGHRGRDRQCRRLRRHRSGGLARLDWSVPDGHRRGDPRARRQRHAARHRPEGHARRARRDRAPAEGAPHRGAARRHAGAAPISGRTMCRRSMRSIRSLPRRTTSCSIRSSWRASRPTPSSIMRDGMHPTAAGVDVIVDRHPAEGGGAVARVQARNA